MEQLTKNGSLVDWVESLIIKRIRDNELTSGSVIPNEQEMAAEYEVGRNVVREALSRLRMLGIIESRQRRGMVVAEPNVMYGFQKVLNPHMLSRKTILDLLGMRVSLEIGSARIIINNITDEDIAELKEIVAREPKGKSPKVDIETERRFHTKIYSIARNRVMLDFLNLLLPVFKFVNENFAGFNKFNSARKGREQLVRHKDLIPFLEARDVEGYQKAVEGHLIAYVDYIAAASDDTEIKFKSKSKSN
jgi:GntR family transcriptional regulator, transcriptional repressor for pyruvate dehydrogenase complex